MSENAVETNEVPEVNEVAETNEIAETPIAEEGVPGTEAELQDAVEEAIEEGASKEEVAHMIKEFELKVNGKNLTKKIDLSDEDAVRKELQLAAAGRQSMQEAAELKKMYAQEIERLMNDPFSVLSELGVDPDELTQNYMEGRIEELKKSPEQVEKERISAELEKARQRERELEEKYQQAELQRLQEQEAIRLDDEISEALQSHQSLPNSSYTVKKIADVMLWAMDNGWDEVTVADIIPTVESEIRNDISNLMNELPEEMLESYVGKKNIERMRQKRLQAAKKVETTKNIQKTTASERKPETPKKRQRIDDWMRS